MRYLKVKVIGDSTVGKTSLLSRWYQQNYPSQDGPGQKQRGNPHSALPPVLESFFVNTSVNCESYIVTYWDTCTMRSFNDMDIAKLKPLEYEDTDVFLACFDISNPKSFQNISTVWVPEMRYYVPGVPLVVVGNKTDLRSSVSLHTTVSSAKGFELAKRLDTVYMETSAVTGEGLNEVIDTALRTALSRTNSSVENKPKRKFSMFSTNPEKAFSKLLEPPSLPRQVPEEIVISIPASKYSLNMKKLLKWNSADCSDFTISLYQCNIAVHRIILCMAGDWFRALLLKKNVTEKELKELLIPHLCDKEDQRAILSEAAQRFLEFIYTLDSPLDRKTNEPVVQKVIEMARVSQLPDLVECCENVLINEDFLNSEVCRVANEQRRQTARELFVNKPILSDVTFAIEDKHIYAHKAIVMARCDVMAAMLGGGFKEGSTEKEIPIAETTEEAFLDLLEYLYTDSLSESMSKDYRQLLVLSDKFCLPRLRALCELCISNQIKREIRKKLNLSSETCRLIVHTLLFAECHNATQLYKWCFYIITIYYADFEKHEDLALLNPQVRANLENHRWPPLSYLTELEEFKRQTNR